ncbi:MAG TPA: GntR family transcriptional regulator [Ktedonobacteraceae bacterium]
MRAMIIDLRLPPGTMVDELSLAAEIGLGRTPVHEAVARLVIDRLVTVLPRRGLMIAPIGLEQVREIFEAREAIECGNAYFAVHHATDADLADLRRLIEAAENAREETDVLRFLEDDQRIHRYLAHIVHNTFLQDAADRILLHNLRFWRFYFTTRRVQPGTLVSHQPLLTALERRDAQEALNAMREHILVSRALLNALF